MASIDTSTGLMNRQSYYRDMSGKANKITAVVSVDMNDLKYLNDTFGRDVGDKVLKTVADVLQRN